MTHLYQLCHNARRMDRHSEAELWARFKAVQPQDACAVTPARPAPHPMPEQIDAALSWAREYLTHNRSKPNENHHTHTDPDHVFPARR